MKLTGAQIVIECLVEQGVNTVFGYPGGAFLIFMMKYLKIAIEFVIFKQHMNKVLLTQQTVMLVQQEKLV